MPDSASGERIHAYLKQVEEYVKQFELTMSAFREFTGRIGESDEPMAAMGVRVSNPVSGGRLIGGDQSFPPNDTADGASEELTIAPKGTIQQQHLRYYQRRSGSR